MDCVLTKVQIFRSGIVVVAKHDGALVSLGPLRDAGRVPCDDLFGADLPDCSLAGRLDGGRVDDVLASSADIGGEGDRQCGRRRDDGEGGEENGEELHLSKWSTRAVVVERGMRMKRSGMG